MKQDYLVNREAKFNTNQLCTIGAALESGIAHGIKGVKEHMDQDDSVIADMYLRHLSIHVDAFNALHVYKDGTKYNYFADLKYDEAAVAELQAMVDAASNDELAKKEGHVTQVWSDGEITSQKAGELLWQRSLHQSLAGIEGVKIDMKWPHQTHSGNGYIFCNGADALKIRKAILAMFIKALT